MAGLHQLHDRLGGVIPKRVKPHRHKITPQIAEEMRREFWDAMDKIEQVAKILDTDAGGLEREAKLLAASTVMTRAEAMYYVAERKLTEARQREATT